MTERLTRRTFLRSSAAGAMALGLSAPGPARPKIRKAVKFGMVQGEGTIAGKFALLKELGFDGVELDAPSGLDRDAVCKARDEVGLPIHGVVDSVHWRHPLSHPDPAIRAKGVAALRRAIDDAKVYGGTTVLLVPAVVNARVAYHHAYQRSQAEIRRVLPYAAEQGIKIALENVWNNFLLSPLEFARYIDEFESPWIGAYFDIGNVVKYGWPEQWIEILGARILKLDVKGYGRKAGFRVEIGEGDVDWKAVNRALDKIGYSGWATAEVRGGRRDRLAEIARRMEDVFSR